MINKKEIILNEIEKNILKKVIIFSAFFLNLILGKYIVILRQNLIILFINSFLTSFITFWVLRKKNIKKINRNHLIISGFIALYSLRIFMNLTNLIINIEILLSTNELKNILILVIGLFALPSLIFFVYLFLDKILPKIKEFLMNLDKIEKKYLIIMGSVGIIVSSYMCLFTTAFINPNGRYDVIYTADQGILMSNDVYMNFSHSENDIRQPLFGVFAYPFGLLAHFFSDLLFFVPNELGYGVLIVSIQFLLTTISTIMLGRLLKLNDSYKKYFYALFSVSFPYLLFNLILEQYAIALFYLILTIYIFFNYDGVNYSYVVSTGTLLTSGILFPLISKARTIKEKVRDICKCFGAFISILIISREIYPINILYQ